MNHPSGSVTDLLVNIDVGDIGRAIDFYTAGLGLTLRRRLGPHIVVYLVMSDPFGNGFCLLQLKGAGYASLESSDGA
jgi:predicted enzyme related to lactoylglutathione lyase